MSSALDIVYLSCCEKWSDWERNGFFSRPAQIARGLAEHADVHRLLVVNTPSSVARAILPSDGRRPRSGLSRVRAREDVYVLDQVRLLPKERVSRVPYHVNGMLHEQPLAGAIRRAALALDMPDPVLWLSGPLVARTAAAFPRSTLVYDAMDEWLALEETRGLRREIEKSYAHIRAHADLVFAVSAGLVQRFEGGGAQVHLSPNAVDASRFAPPDGEAAGGGPGAGPRTDGADDRPTAARTPVALSAIPAPRVGYVGMLQDRIDVPLVADIALRMPNVSFVLLGPLLDEAHFAPLRILPNVHFPGPCPPDVLPDHLATFDACFLPHVDNELTRNMDPLKLYEFIAAGKPVVASDVAFVQPPELVRRARTAEEFAWHLADAISGRWTVDDGVRRRHLAQSTWPSRVSQMLARVHQVRDDEARSACANLPRTKAVTA